MDPGATTADPASISVPSSNLIVTRSPSRLNFPHGRVQPHAGTKVLAAATTGDGLSGSNSHHPAGRTLPNPPAD